MWTAAASHRAQMMAAAESSERCGQNLRMRSIEAGKIAASAVQKWTSSAIDQLQDCLESTNWPLFKDTADDIHRYPDTVSCYINWWISICIPCTEMIVYPNQKPWFNNEIRKKRRERNTAFKTKDPAQFKIARYALEKAIQKRIL
ncbi:hypothetical protein XELAEV_18004120mg [Xenopus laevis]|uniref:Uncharacterized protein n=1 Tax=Xenopus laevis TaxID=8355 RepID=A0A974BRU4_XENLA|nr:hypothetical protein XELAEV_18004120mg [Xenopus laevis]